MLYNYYFDICAMCILATIAIISLFRRKVPAYRQRAYSMLLMAIIIATVAQRVETLLQMNPIDAVGYPVAEKIAGSIYFIAHLGSAVGYLFYVMALLDIYADLRKFKNFMSVAFGYCIGIGLVVVNWFYPVLFHYDEKGIYNRDSLIIIYYLLAGYYIGYGLLLIFRYNTLMKLKTKIVVASYVLFAFAGLILQFFLPNFLVENFCVSLSATLVFITLQNPSEMVDEYLNILNKKAFLEGLDLNIKRKSTHSTIFVTIENIRALTSEIGYTQSQKVLKIIARYLKRVGFREFRLQTYVYRYSEYLFAITVHSADEQKARLLLDRIAKRIHEPWESSGMQIRIEGHVFLMRYPQNYSTSPELMTKIDILTDDLSRYKDVIIDTDNFEYNEIKKARDIDFTVRTNLDNKTAVVKFQPILSKIYKINYNVDAICFFADENGEEIDVRGKIPDVKTTQALMDTDEYVFRKACRALSFWNDGDKNGKYRAVVGLSQGEISKNDFIRRIKRILREEKAEASWISVKLSETTVTTMNKVAERNIRMLGEMNCSIIIDAFGSGYGDLNRILSLPIMQVNVDKSVRKSAMESEQMKIVAQGIVNLFHDVSIFVGATNIDSEKDKKMAEELGCDFLVGDYMGPPVPDSSFARTIDAYFDEG